MPPEMASASPSAGQFVSRRWIHSETSKYEVRSFLGKGTFGKVAKCIRMDNMKTVAIKMIKNKGSFRKQAKDELAAVQRVKMLDSDKCNLVQWNHVFLYKGHICLEFEHLDKSLFDFMRARNFKPLRLKEIRPIVHQLATALNHLKSIGIIHADLKLENVMLVNHQQEPYRVKVIDFGLAHHVSVARPGAHLQSRPYRSPEIMLGLPFTEAIDMWSLGCVAAFLYTGALLYPGSCEYDMMRFIVETQGQLPDSILSSGRKTRRFFQREMSSTTSSLWKLKSPQQFQKESGFEPKDTRQFKFSSLDGLLNVQCKSLNNLSQIDKIAEMTDIQMFVDMLKGMLHLDASRRMSPCHVLEHQFVSLRHVEHLCSISPLVKSCYHLMAVCQRTLTSDSLTSVQPAKSQQPSCRASPSIQQNCSPHAAGRSSQEHCPESPACSKIFHSGQRRPLNGDVDAKQCHIPKRTKLEAPYLQHRQHLSTFSGSTSSSSSSSQHSACLNQNKIGMRTRTGQPQSHHHTVNFCPSENSNSLISVRQDKRKEMPD